MKVCKLTNSTGVLLLLFAGMVWATFMLFVAEEWFKDDGQLFTLVGSVLSGFTAAFFTRIQQKPSGPVPPVPPNATVDTTTTVHSAPAPESKG